MKKSIVGGVKELLRIVIIAILPILLASVDMKTGHIDINWTLVAGMAFLAIVKGVDKWVHMNPKIDSDGILPF